MAAAGHANSNNKPRSSWLYRIKSLFTTKMTKRVEIQKQSRDLYASTSSSDSGGGCQEGDGAAAATATAKAAAQPNNSSNGRNSSRRQRGGQRRLSSDQQNLMSYVPQYLKTCMYPYHGEFCYTPIFQPRFIAQVMAEGFLPVATQGMLLPKLHNNRCVVRLKPDELHISKSVKKKSKRFTLTVNQRFEDVIQGCHEQHGRHCWLYPPLVESLREMTKAGKIEASVMDERTGKPISFRSWTVRLYTVEVWNAETGNLAGGELGYTVGSIYTSLTGFTKEDSAGSVQLVALGRLLLERGFHMWDLGMDMEYKRGIGSHLMPRETFLSNVHACRETHGHLTLPVDGTPRNCKEIIDRNSPSPVASQQSQHAQHQHQQADQRQNQQQQHKEKKQKKKSPKPKKDGDINNSNNNNDNKPPQASKEHSHTPPLTEAEAPIKKRVRKSESDS